MFQSLAQNSFHLRCIPQRRLSRVRQLSQRRLDELRTNQFNDSYDKLVTLDPSIRLHWRIDDAAYRIQTARYSVWSMYVLPFCYLKVIGMCNLHIYIKGKRREILWTSCQSSFISIRIIPSKTQQSRYERQNCTLTKPLLTFRVCAYEIAFSCERLCDRMDVTTAAVDCETQSTFLVIPLSGELSLHIMKLCGVTFVNPLCLFLYKVRSMNT